MGRASRAAWWLVATWLVAPGVAPAQTTPPPRTRTLRVGNINVMTFGGGYASYDHPNFDDHSFPAVAYQRRVLRREMRQFPLWLRAAFQFHSENEKCHGNCYTVWTIDPGTSPFPDSIVSEHTSDVAFRGEILIDVLHTANSGLYGGGGFMLHSLSFSSDGVESGFPPFHSSATETSASGFVGLRVFSASRTYTGYAEARYGQIFGKTDQNGVDNRGQPLPYLTDATFDFMSRNALFVEGGLGFHW